MSTDHNRPGLERPTSRADLARQLLARVERLEVLLGTIPLATEIQLLKRDMRRGHAVLIGPEDNDYLSVVCLVEAALESLTWKLYTPVVLAALRRAFSAGTRDGAFTCEEYAALRRHFRESDIPGGPSIALDSPDAEPEGEGRPQAEPRPCAGQKSLPPSLPPSGR